ncbi:MAG: hypothetical protein JWM14_1750 [Chitinophagaceae bacterium]|nr:hypothetical protein [Chitinophagaceae bacterium]
MESIIYRQYGNVGYLSVEQFRLMESKLVFDYKRW